MGIKVKKGVIPEVKWETLFTLENDVLDEATDYQIMETVPARLALQYLRNVQTIGTERATSIALMEIMGARTFDAIADSPEIDDETAKQLWAIAQSKLLGALETIQGN